MSPMSPEIVELAIRLSYAEAKQLEKFVINQLKSKDLGCLTNANMGGGGRSPGWSVPLNVREKMSHSAKGKIISQGQRDKARAINLGKKHTLESKAKMGRSGKSNPSWGRRASLETRAKQSAAAKAREIRVGHPQSLEALQKFKLTCVLKKFPAFLFSPLWD